MQTHKIAKRMATFTFLCALVAVAALLMSCGSSSSTTKINTTPKFLVAPDQTAGAHVNVFTIAVDGTLTAVASSPQDMSVTGVEPIVIDPIKNDILFVADTNDGKIRSWSIDSAGKLTTIDTTAAASASTGGGGDGSFFYRRDALAVSPDGKCLYSALGNTHVGAFQIGSDNKFTARAELDVSSDDATAETGAVAANTGFAYITNVDNTHVLVAKIGSDCSLTLQAALTKNVNADGGASDLRSLAISPSGKHLIVGDDNAGAITTYSISSTDGSLTNTQNALAPAGGCDLESVAFSPDGKFVYASSCGSDMTASAFDDTAGTVTGDVAGAPFSSPSAGTVVVDRSNSLVFTSDECGAVVSFKRDTTTGVLAPATGNITHTAGNTDNVCSVAVTY